jgi:hypothetical protein
VRALSSAITIKNSLASLWFVDLFHRSRTGRTLQPSRIAGFRITRFALVLVGLGILIVTSSSQSIFRGWVERDANLAIQRGFTPREIATSTHCAAEGSRAEARIVFRTCWALQGVLHLFLSPQNGVSMYTSVCARLWQPQVQLNCCQYP